MKQLSLSVLFIVYCFSLYPQESENINKVEYDFAITRPTVYNLQRIIYLIENNIIQIPDVSILAVYYEKEDYDYNESVSFINDNRTSINLTLYKLTGELNKENIFTENSLSKQFDEIFKITNAILFFGGDDLPAYTYYEKTDLTTIVEDTYRHFFELSFLFHLVGAFNQEQGFVPLLEKKSEYLVWTFCLGTQTLNVAAGGTLVQDIPSEIYDLNYVEDVFNLPLNNIHKNYYHVLYPEKDFTGSILHQIYIPDSSYLLGFTNDNKEPFVNSYHHQCIGDLGKDLYPIAFSMDGKIIEAVKHKRFKNVLGLQFHPEKIELYDQSEKLHHLPEDTVYLSYYELLNNNNSYQFHVNMWKEFSKLLLILKN